MTGSVFSDLFILTAFSFQMIWRSYSSKHAYTNLWTLVHYGSKTICTGRISAWAYLKDAGSIYSLDSNQKDILLVLKEFNLQSSTIFLQSIFQALIRHES